MEGALVFILGLVVGSFFNVVIYRLPEGESIILPGSFCPACGTRLKVRDLIPVISFISTRGRCRYCGSRISYQYPLVELGTAVVFGLLYRYYNLSLLFFIYGVLAGLLIIAAGIDFNRLLIPNRITYPGLLFGLAASLIGGHLSFKAALVGALLSAGCLFIVAIVSRGGLGLGDVKLAALIGSFLGVGQTLLAVFIASLLGSVVAIYLLLVKQQSRKTKLPFGVFMALGGLLVVFWGEIIVEVYWQLFI